MAQLPDPYERLTTEQRTRFDAMQETRGKIKGMYRVLFNHPELTLTVSDLGTFVRFGGVLSYRQKEVAILTAARDLQAAFVWQQHVGPAREAGTPGPTIDGILAETGPPVVPDYDEDLLVWRVALLAVRCKSIPDSLADDVICRVGIEGLVELVIVSSFYRMIASVVCCFDVPLPDPAHPPF